MTSRVDLRGISSSIRLALVCLAMGPVSRSTSAQAQQSTAKADQPLSRAEAMQQMDAEFRRFDGNGALSAAEFAGLINPTAIAVDPAPLMTQLDTDRDGVITLVECRIATQGNFDRIDTDRDAIVAVPEMRAARIVR